MVEFQSFRVEFSIGFKKRQYQNFFVHNFLCPCLFQPQPVVSELRILLEQPIQLPIPGRQMNFAFQTEFAHFPNLNIFFLSTKALQHLRLTCYLALVSLCGTTCRRQAMDFTSLAGTSCGLPLAAACCWKPSEFSEAATVVARSFSMLKLFLLEV